MLLRDPQTTNDARRLTVFPVAGVVASEGGLGSIVALVGALGTRPGFALVILYVADDAAPADTLNAVARSTQLPVQEAGDGVRLEVDRIYLAPAHAQLSVRQGVLQVTALEGSTKPSADRFLRGLAAEYGTFAMGVALSGATGRGSRGISAIKHAGGFTYAQDLSAKFRALPDAAIAAGAADLVLAPEQVARDMQELARLLRSAAPNPASFELHFRLCDAAHRSTGLELVDYDPERVRRCVWRRMLLRRVTQPMSYVALLESDPSEADALVDDALALPSPFSREDTCFADLAKSVYQTLMSRMGPDTPLRIWVPGCSTGEAAVSVAISLFEFASQTGLPHLPLKLIATDARARAIAQARTCIFSDGIEDELTPARLERFFVKVPLGYQLRSEVREVCVFGQHELIRNPPFARMDLIVCRQLLDVLRSASQERALRVLHYALKPGGFLVLDRAEASIPNGFTALEGTRPIYLRTLNAPAPTLEFTTSGRARHKVSAAAARGEDIERELDRVLLQELAPAAVVVSDDLTIVRIRGQTSGLLSFAPGAASLQLMHMVPEALRVPLRQAIARARATQEPARASARDAATGRQVSVRVLPLDARGDPQPHFAILFQESVESEPATSGSAPADVELASTRIYAESAIEELENTNQQLRAANDEVAASNEALLSANAELAKTQLSLQATNQELHTANAELATRSAESARLSDDLSNVLASGDHPFVIVAPDGTIRRFAPAAARLLQLRDADLGRPLVELASLRVFSALPSMVTQVLERLLPLERSAQDAAGRWYRLAVRPYLTRDRRVDGVLISLIDIDAIKRGIERADQAQSYAEAIVDTVHQSLVVVDGELCVRSANRAFRELFRVPTQDIEGKRLYDIEPSAWQAPALRAKLELLRETESFDGIASTLSSEYLGTRELVSSARRIRNTDLWLLVLEDVTEREQARRAAARAEIEFREMLATAPEAIIMSDADHRIVWTNRCAANLFGFEPTELAQQPIDALLPERLRGEYTRHTASLMHGGDANGVLGPTELMGVRKDGSEFPFEVVLGLLRRNDASIAVSFISDTTRRRESERQIRQYQTRLQRMTFEAAIAEERERRRIASGLHDRVGQTLALAQMRLSSVNESTAPETRTAIDEATGLVSQSISDIRTLIFELSPPVLYDLGLEAALSWLVEDVEKRSGVRVELIADAPDEPLDDATAALVYRAVRELLMNVVKHADAPRATVTLRRAADCMHIDVEDRGIGFNPNDQAAGQTTGFGLFSVREQISRLGGSVELQSAPGAGTRVQLRIPLPPQMPEPQEGKT